MIVCRLISLDWVLIAEKKLKYHKTKCPCAIRCDLSTGQLSTIGIGEEEAHFDGELGYTYFIRDNIPCWVNEEDVCVNFIERFKIDEILRQPSS